MTVFRAGLILAWLAVLWLLIYASATLGIVDGVLIFFSDFRHPWRAQFNTDLIVHVLLVASWIVYREDKRVIGVSCALLTLLLGSIFWLPYVFVTTFRESGRVECLLLGRHARKPSLNSCTSTR